MYEFIKGVLTDIEPDYVVVDNSGIGFQILTPNPFAFADKEGEKVIIYTYQHVREDLIALYGFRTSPEREMFKKLIGVSGIGPKGALAILAFGEPDQVIEAIETEDEKFLIKFPGVGKKTARQMILDLKGKLKGVLSENAALKAPDSREQSTPTHGPDSKAQDEAFLALTALGYSQRELEKVAPLLQEEELPTDQYIKKALRLLMR